MFALSGPAQPFSYPRGFRPPAPSSAASPSASSPFPPFSSHFPAKPVAIRFSWLYPWRAELAPVAVSVRAVFALVFVVTIIKGALPLPLLSAVHPPLSPTPPSEPSSSLRLPQPLGPPKPLWLLRLPSPLRHASLTVTPGDAVDPWRACAPWRFDLEYQPAVASGGCHPNHQSPRKRSLSSYFSCVACPLV